MQACVVNVYSRHFLTLQHFTIYFSPKCQNLYPFETYLKRNPPLQANIPKFEPLTYIYRYTPFIKKLENNFPCAI